MRAGKCQLIKKKIEIKSHIFRQRRFLRLIPTSIGKKRYKFMSRVVEGSARYYRRASITFKK